MHAVMPKAGQVTYTLPLYSPQDIGQICRSVQSKKVMDVYWISDSMIAVADLCRQLAWSLYTYGVMNTLTPCKTKYN
jgi:hypothetical protein